MGPFGTFVDIRTPGRASGIAFITRLARTTGCRAVVRDRARSVCATQIVALNIPAILDAGFAVAGITLFAVSAHRRAITVEMAPGVGTAPGGIRHSDIAKRNAFPALVEAKPRVARACVPGIAAAGINTMRVCGAAR